MRINSLVFLLAAFLLVPCAARAQGGVLDQAERRITGGEMSQARALLSQWRQANQAGRAEAEEQARFHMLSARVTTNADSAEDNYLTVALNYPTARVAPEALLRLAQGRHARGDEAQAITYLERLLADYPESEQRALGAIWLARVKSGTGENAALCQLLRNVDAGTNPETIQHLRNERGTVCAGIPGAAKAPAPKPAARTPAPAKPKADSTPAVKQPEPGAPAGAGRVAIQIGAFRELSGARGVQIQLERAGFTNVRLVRVPGNQLIRVRIGNFANRAAAADVLARLARAEFSAVLVTDANSETPVKN